mmetsp:Transcript_35079/g.82683  ORF Transcript_35079/g.82683 Transcript_35079/m.82683 type:complete len:247 (+) Transcript_35079:218-958(+)
MQPHAPAFSAPSFRAHLTSSEARCSSSLRPPRWRGARPMRRWASDSTDLEAGSTPQPRRWAPHAHTHSTHSHTRHTPALITRFRSQLLGALLRGDGRAAAAAAAAAAASREGGQRAGDRDGWAQREHRVRAGDIDFWARTGQTGAPPSLPEGGSVREHVPTPKRKHESSDSPVLVGRARTTQLALGQELQADNALWPTTRMIAGKATPAAEHFEYDADDDSESEWVGHDAFDSPWPTRAGAAMEMG